MTDEIKSPRALRLEARNAKKEVVEKSKGSLLSRALMTMKGVAVIAAFMAVASLSYVAVYKTGLKTLLSAIKTMQIPALSVSLKTWLTLASVSAIFGIVAVGTYAYSFYNRRKASSVENVPASTVEVEKAAGPASTVGDVDELGLDGARTFLFVQYPPPRRSPRNHPATKEADANSARCFSFPVAHRR